MPDQRFYRGQIHSNHKFGLPTPRTSREAFGMQTEWHRDPDKWVFAVVMVCFAIGLFVVGF
jgi:hypothetical protein